jgi:hypothetical protein
MFDDAFEASRAACKMMKNRAVGIIGPSSPRSATIVRSVCDAKEILLMETRIVDVQSKHVINLHPTPEELGRAYLDLINAWNWQGFTILYEDAPWLPMIEYVLRNYKKKFTVAVRQLDITANGNYRSRLLQVKQSNELNIVLCCSSEKLPEVLKQAQQVGLLSDKHNVLITSPDMHTIDLEPYQYGGTNITGIRLVDPDDALVKEVTEDIKKIIHSNSDAEGNVLEVPDGLTAEKMEIETALTFDAGNYSNQLADF